MSSKKRTSETCIEEETIGAEYGYPKGSTNSNS
jgi:hypothetical protein